MGIVNRWETNNICSTSFMEISDDRECVAHHCHLNIRHPKKMKRKRRIEKKTCRTRRRKGRQI